MSENQTLAVLILKTKDSKLEMKNFFKDMVNQPITIFETQITNQTPHFVKGVRENIKVLVDLFKSVSMVFDIDICESNDLIDFVKEFIVLGKVRSFFCLSNIEGWEEQYGTSSIKSRIEECTKKFSASFGFPFLVSKAKSFEIDQTNYLAVSVLGEPGAKIVYEQIVSDLKFNFSEVNSSTIGKEKKKSLLLKS